MLNSLFFLIFALFFVLLFIIFAILRQPIKARFNVFYCGFCYACVAMWGILLLAWVFDVFTPSFELLAILLGMSGMGIWQELKKRNLKNIGIFTIFWILFSVFVFYSVEIASKTYVVCVVLVFVIIDIYLLTHKHKKISEDGL